MEVTADSDDLCATCAHKDAVTGCLKRMVFLPRWRGVYRDIRCEEWEPREE